MKRILLLCLLLFGAPHAPAVTLTPLSCAVTPTANTCPVSSYQCLPAQNGMIVATPSGIWREWSTLAAGDYVRAWNDDIAPGAACTGSRVSVFKSQAAVYVPPPVDPPPPPAAAIKWHPGWYPYNSRFRWNDAYRDELFALIDQTCDNPAIKGYAIHKYWFNYEGATAGDYSNGFAMVDEILAKLSTCTVAPKRLIMIVEPASYANTTGSIVPAYVENTPGWFITNTSGTTWPGALTTLAAYWKPAVMDRLIALGSAYCAHYDNNPNVEMIQAIGVSSLQPQPYGYEGYNHAAAYTQLTRAVNEITGCDHTMLRMPADYLENQMLTDLLNLVATKRNWAWGDFDPELPLPPPLLRKITGRQAFKGLLATTGAADMRGVVPSIVETQALGNGDCYYGNAYGIPSPIELYNYFKGATGEGMYGSHYIIMQNTWTACGTTTNRWGQWLPVINANPYMNETPPTNLGAVNTN